MRSHFFSLAFLACLWSPAQLAGAHATPILYEPAASSVLPIAPDTIEIRFSERIEQAASVITVFAPDGSLAKVGSANVDRSDPYRFRIALLQKTNGTYTVSWQVISADDGHFTKGAFGFSVGTQTATVSTVNEQVNHRSDWPEAITVFLELLGQALLIGCLLYARYFRPTLKIEQSNDKRERQFMLAGALLIIAGSAGYLLLDANNLAVSEGIDLASSLRKFLSTVTGSYALWRMILGIVCVPLLLTKKRSPFGRAEWLLLILILIMAFMRARVSHAAASSFLPHFSITINFLHLLSKDVWIASLIVVALLLLPILDRQKNALLNARIFLKLGWLTLVSFATGGLTGCYIVWLHLKSFSNIPFTHWGGEFASLVIVAGILLALRLLQWFTVLPSLIQIAKQEKPSMEHATRFAGSLLILEAATGVTVLLLSAMLLITTPPLSSWHLFSRQTQSQGATIALAEAPFEDDAFLVTIQSPLPVQGVVVTLTNPDKNIGPIIAQTEKRFEGGYMFPKSQLSLPGAWNVAITAMQSPAYDAVASFTVDSPTDLDTRASSDHTRSFDTFSIMCLCTALMIILGCFRIFRHLRAMNQTLSAVQSTTSPSERLTPRFIWPLFIISFSFLLFFGSGHAHGNAEFQRECLKDGGQWHESVPMRDGRATSHITFVGCMIGAGEGTFHFADPREFAYFTRHVSTYVTMDAEPKILQPNIPEVITFHILDSQNKPVPDLTREHDRIAHIVIVSGDLETFAHVHPEDFGPVTPAMTQHGTYSIRYTFPRAGKYLIAIDYTIGAQTFVQTFPITVGSVSAMQSPVIDWTRQEESDGMQVTLWAPKDIHAGTYAHFRYEFSKDGMPVTDLEPYLSAGMHLAVVKTDLVKFQHVHALLPQSLWDSIFSPRNPRAKHTHVALPEHFGPTLEADISFPLPGTYIIFGQYKHEGKIATTSFTLAIEE